MFDMFVAQLNEAIDKAAREKDMETLQKINKSLAAAMRRIQYLVEGR